MGGPFVRKHWVVAGVAGLAAFLILGGLGCKEETVIIHATVNTQYASLANLGRGTPGAGGLTVRVDILAAQQRSMASRLDSATQAAQGLREEADRLANKWDEAVRKEADEAMRTAAGDADAGNGDGEESETPNPSGG